MLIRTRPTGEPTGNGGDGKERSLLLLQVTCAFARGQVIHRKVAEIEGCLVGTNGVRWEDWMATKGENVWCPWA